MIYSKMFQKVSKYPFKKHFIISILNKVAIVKKILLPKSMAPNPEWLKAVLGKQTFRDYHAYYKVK